MAEREVDRALEAVKRHEAPGRVKDVARLLGAPPLVFVVGVPALRLVGVEPGAVVVVGHRDVVERDGIEGVAVEVPQAAVDGAVHRDFGVAVQVAAHDLVRLAAKLHAVSAHAPDLLVLPRVGSRGFAAGRGTERDQGGRIARQRARLQHHRRDLVVHREDNGQLPPVAYDGRDDAGFTGRGRQQRVLPRGARRQQNRMHPLRARQRGGIEVEEMTRVAALGHRLVTQEQPYPSRAIHAEPRVLKQVLLEEVRVGRFRLGPGLKQLAAGQHGDSRATIERLHRVRRPVNLRAPLAQPDAVLGILVAGVLAPVGAAFLPGDPHAAGAVHRHVGAHLGERRGRHLRRRPEGAVRPGAEQQVVAGPAAVGVPGHPGPAVACRHRRLPVVFGRGADVELLAPALCGPNAHQDLALSRRPAKAHPHQVQVALLVGGHPVEHVGHRAARELLFLGPLTALEHPRVQVEVAALRLLLEAVHAPDVPAPVLAQGHAEMIARRGDGDRPGPSAAVRAARHHDLVGAGDVVTVALTCPVSDPGQPIGAVAGAQQRRVVVLGQLAGHGLGNRHALDRDVAVESLDVVKRAVRDLGRNEGEIAVAGEEGDRVLLGRHEVEDHRLGGDVAADRPQRDVPAVGRADRVGLVQVPARQAADLRRIAHPAVPDHAVRLAL